MLDRLRLWLSADDPVVDEDPSWRLSLWWGAVVVALFTIAISICHDPSDGVVAAPTSTSTAPTTTIAPPGGPTLLDIFNERADLTFFRSLIAAGGIEESLANEGPFTFFVPTDIAFSALDQATRETMLADQESAILALRAHVSVGPFSMSELATAGSVPLASLVTEPVVFEGGTYFVGSAQVLDPDIEAVNGFVHVIDTFLGTGQGDGGPGEQPSGALGDLISGRSDLSTLAAALAAAGDASPLAAADKEFTVFAPNNEAFDGLPAGSVEVLVAAPPQLLELLGFHVVPGIFTSADLTDGLVMTTSTGEELAVAVDGAAITVGDATVIEADVQAADGVLHVVDGVMLPPEFSLPTVNEALGLEPITFETNSATITPEGIEALGAAVEFLEANPGVRVAIEGHTDSQGGETANLRLSEARAEAVRDYLVSQGIDTARLETAGFGEARPIADNSTPEGRAENRRIEFRLLG